MGFLDSIRDRFRGEADDGYYEDDYYDGYEGDQGYDEPAPGRNYGIGLNLAWRFE